MALKIVWTKRAEVGYEKIIDFLEQNWTDKEIKVFLQKSKYFFELLKQFPELLQKSSTKRNVHRGPLDKHTIITYRIKKRKQQIEIVNIRSARRMPLKD